MRASTKAVRRSVVALLVAAASACVQASALGPDGEPGRMHAGKFIWFDLATDDPAGARAFYGAVFGWRFREVEGGPVSYTLIEHSGGKVGGLMRRARPQGAPVGSRWLSLISVRDVASAAEYVKRSGGLVVVAPTKVAQRGTHAVFRDPQGAVFGVLAAEGGDPRDDPVIDGDVFWLDLFVEDPAGAAKFYAGLAEYEVSEAESSTGRRRWLLASEGIARGGITALRNRAAGPGWLPYILVSDVPATMERARAAGGKVIFEPRADLLDGNVAVIADPNGGLVGIVNWPLSAQPGAALR